MVDEEREREIERGREGTRTADEYPIVKILCYSSAALCCGDKTLNRRAGRIGRGRRCVVLTTKTTFFVIRFLS